MKYHSFPVACNAKELCDSILELEQTNASIRKDDGTILTTFIIKDKKNDGGAVSFFLEQDDTSEDGQDPPLGILQARGLTPTGYLYSRSDDPRRDDSWEKKKESKQFSLPLSIPANSKMISAIQETEKAIAKMVEKQGSRRGEESKDFLNIPIKSKVRAMSAYSGPMSLVFNVSPVCVFVNRSVSTSTADIMGLWHDNPCPPKAKVLSMAYTPTSVTFVRSKANNQRFISVNWSVDYVRAENSMTNEERIQRIECDPSSSLSKRLAGARALAMMEETTAAQEMSTSNLASDGEDNFDSDVEQIPSTPPRNGHGLSKRKTMLGSNAPVKRARTSSS